MADSPHPSARDPEIAAVFRRPFAEQVDFFRAKLGNLVPTQRWTDVWKAQHDRAFMVAGAAKADLLADLASAVEKAIADGESIDKFRARFAEIVDRHGWEDWTGSKTAAGRAWRTRVIYTTNAATSYAAGRLAQLKEGGFAFWVYKHSDNVLHPRPLHVAWDGLTLPADHEWWRTHYPPNGWGCKCYVVGARDARSARRLGGDPDRPLDPAWNETDPRTGEPIGIDRGWGYQPGATSSALLREFVPEYRDDLPPPCVQMSCGAGRAPDEPLPPPRVVSADRVLPDGREPQWYIHRFLEEFGVAPGEIGVYTDVTGHGLAIGEAMFADRRGRLKIMKRERMRSVLLLADTIRSPDEIRVSLERARAGGKSRLRRRYIARWQIEGQDVPALVVFEWSRDLWTGITAFSPDDVSYLERRGRIGEVVWRRQP